MMAAQGNSSNLWPERSTPVEAKNAFEHNAVFHILHLLCSHLCFLRFSSAFPSRLDENCSEIEFPFVGDKSVIAESMGQSTSRPRYATIICAPSAVNVISIVVYTC